MATTAETAVYAAFGGREAVKFQLRLGEIGELERRCAAGIGEIMLRVAGHRFYAADVRETIRLGLIGGGESQAGAEALIRYNVDGQPIVEGLELATRILQACISGVAPPGNPEAEGSSADPATSPPTTSPAA